MFGLLLIVAIVVLLLKRLPSRQSKLRDSYAYDRVEDAGLLSDAEDDEDALGGAFLSYKQLKSRFKDTASDEENDHEDDGEEEDEETILDRTQGREGSHSQIV